MRYKPLVLTAIILFTTLSIQSCQDHKIEYFQGALSTVHPIATEVGREVLARGGNVVDCAVAVGFTLAVVYPQAGNLGGGGFALIYVKDSSLVTTLDFREKAPLFATEDMYLDSLGNPIDDASLLGYKAAAVPGTVAGLLEMHHRFGILPLEDLLSPAIELAENGFAVDSVLSVDLVKQMQALAEFESTREVFFKDGVPLRRGDTLVQTNLAEVLKRIAGYGVSGFYGGRTADLLEQACIANGGLITRTDLKEYKPRWRLPISCEFDDLRIFSMGPPSSGGILLAEIFNMLSQFSLPKDSPYNPIFVHLFAEICKRAYADRAEFLGDFDFVDVPIRELTSIGYAVARISDFDPMQATPSAEIAPGQPTYESEQTTHYSIVDSYGNALALTYTINASFGSKVVADSLGFFLNNEMDDFVIKPGVPNLYGLVGGEANKITPQKRPLSSMSPTIVFKDDEPVMVTGSPGGSKIITTVALSILFYYHFNFSLERTVFAPRYHHQHLPDAIFYEPGAFDDQDLKNLIDMGHTMTEHSPYGCLNVLARKSSNSGWQAVSDDRRGGQAIVIE